MKKKSLQLLLVVSTLFGLVWLGGLVLAFQTYWAGTAAPLPPTASPSEQAPTEATVAPTPTTTPANAPSDGSYRVVALGDSLTVGYGDPEGGGYVGHLVKQLKERTDKPIQLENLGVNGQTSPQLVELLKQEQVQRQVQAANVLLVSIGGNDLFRGGETLLNLDLVRIKELRDAYNTSLKTILGELRRINREADIFLIGLYNPFIELQSSEQTSAVVREWNYQAAETAVSVPQTVVVPTYDLFQLQVNDYLYEDQFHPNAKGYERIAERLAALITW